MSYDIFDELADGTFNVSVTAYDRAGSPSSATMMLVKNTIGSTADGELLVFRYIVYNLAPGWQNRIYISHRRSYGVMVAYKNYNIVIKGRVQDAGFRNLVENIAKSLALRGMVYNDIDGTVKIVCAGAVSAVKELVEEIRDKCVNVGAFIDDVQQEEIPGKVALPPYFFTAPTDQFSDISRKLDTGNQKLDILIAGQNTLIEGQSGLLNKTDSLVEGQKSLLTGQEKMIKLLERIAEK